MKIINKRVQRGVSIETIVEISRIYVCAGMHMSDHLEISRELKNAFKSLLYVSFTDAYWQDDFESFPPVRCLKHRSLCDVISKILAGKGTKDNFVTLREACVPTEWLVTFLEVWQWDVEQKRGQDDLVKFIQGIIDKLVTIYTMLNDAGYGHSKWTQVETRCLSVLFTTPTADTIKELSVAQYLSGVTSSE